MLDILPIAYTDPRGDDRPARPAAHQPSRLVGSGSARVCRGCAPRVGILKSATFFREAPRRCSAALGSRRVCKLALEAIKSLRFRCLSEHVSRWILTILAARELRAYCP